MEETHTQHYHIQGMKELVPHWLRALERRDGINFPALVPYLTDSRLQKLEKPSNKQTKKVQGLAVRSKAGN